MNRDFMDKTEEMVVKYVIDYENSLGKRCWRVSRKKKIGCDLRTQDGKYIELRVGANLNLQIKFLYMTVFSSI